VQQLSRVAHYNEFLSQCRNSDIQTLWQLRTLAVVPQAATECYKLTTHLCGMLLTGSSRSSAYPSSTEFKVRYDSSVSFHAYTGSRLVMVRQLMCMYGWMSMSRFG
jgi:hypothetical protein